MKKRKQYVPKNERWIRYDVSRMTRSQLEDQMSVLGYSDEAIEKKTSDEMRRIITKKMAKEYNKFEEKTGFR